MKITTEIKKYFNSEDGRQLLFYISLMPIYGFGICVECADELGYRLALIFVLCLYVMLLAMVRQEELLISKNKRKLFKELDENYELQKAIIDELETYVTMMQYYPGNWQLPAEWFDSARLERVKKNLDAGLASGKYLIRKTEEK